MNKFKQFEISKAAQSNVAGGDITALIQAAWDATPDGGGSYWENIGDINGDGWDDFGGFIWY